MTIDELIQKTVGPQAFHSDVSAYYLKKTLEELLSRIEQLETEVKQLRGTNQKFPNLENKG